MSDFPAVRAFHPAWRLIPSRFSPIGAFDTVVTPADLQAVMELEGWTNDRMVAERLARLQETEWVHGSPNASVVMAAFLHAAPEGGRFNGPELGAWYAAASLTTAIAEVAHHLRREAAARGQHEVRRVFRCYVARLTGEEFVDLRGQRAGLPDLYDLTSYTVSQPFGETTRPSGRSGILYDSLRHAGGMNAVAYRPKQVVDILQADHYDLIVPLRGKIIARRLTEPA